MLQQPFLCVPLTERLNIFPEYAGGPLEDQLFNWLHKLRYGWARSLDARPPTEV